LVARGLKEKLTGRQLLLDAYHHVVELEKGDRPEKTPPNFSAGCRLITFIKALFINEYADMVLDSTPDNMEGISFKEAFKDALVCFTHFGKMADDTGITSAAAWAAFIRHMAIMCRNGQRTVDCILPVLLWDTRLCEHVMTGVLVQIKRQIKAGTVAELSIDQAEVNFFPKALEKCTHGSNPTSYRPYVSLIMELGVQVKPPEEAQTATIYKSANTLRRRRQRNPAVALELHHRLREVQIMRRRPRCTSLSMANNATPRRDMPDTIYLHMVAPQQCTAASIMPTKLRMPSF